MKAAKAGKKAKAVKGPSVKEQKNGQATEKAKSLDQFLDTWSDSDDSDGEEGVEKKEEEDSDEEEGSSSEEEQQDSDDEGEDSSSDLEAEEKSQKDYLKNLDKEDPEFYKFLQEEGDESLINQAAAASDDEDEEQEESGEEEEDQEESDGEQPAEATDQSVDKWSEALKTKPTVQVVAEVVKAFR